MGEVLGSIPSCSTRFCIISILILSWAQIVFVDKPSIHHWPRGGLAKMDRLAKLGMNAL
ncbi:hypothetical protein BJX70DRAFT_366658 [Aspergillus crustosus]